MYIPRMRKISQIVKEMKEKDANTAITYYLIETMLLRNKLTKIKWSNTWLLNIDELYGFFTGDKTENNQDSKTEIINQKKSTTGEIYRTFLKEDKDTMIRRTNMRTFAAQKNVKHTVCQRKWLIDMNDLLSKLNPNNISKHYDVPRLRTKISAQNDWNSHHRTKIKHHIIDQICDAKKVFVYHHGQVNIINYDELEKEIIKIMKYKYAY